MANGPTIKILKQFIYSNIYVLYRKYGIAQRLEYHDLLIGLSMPLYIIIIP